MDTNELPNVGDVVGIDWFSAEAPDLGSAMRLCQQMSAQQIDVVQIFPFKSSKKIQGAVGVGGNTFAAQSEDVICIIGTRPHVLSQQEFDQIKTAKDSASEGRIKV